MDDILQKIEDLMLTHDKISPGVVKKRDVKLGLRNQDGSGVVVGLTTKGRVVGYKKVENEKQGVASVKGKLYYCGYDVEKIIEEVSARNDFGFEEVIYLLLAGELPNQSDLDRFKEALARRRALSKSERSVIMEEVQNNNQMYGLHSVISHLGRCDPRADALEIQEVSRQCINLIAKAPTIVANNYNVTKFRVGGDLKILRPKSELSMAENFLYMLKGGRCPDPEEAHLFDICLILHAEHGGGNNSTFTVRTVSSSGANTYMALAAGIASLSGHLHGGANESVIKMMKSIKKHVRDWSDEKAIEDYLKDLLDKKRGDRTGKIYGFGHAVYTISDPRALILRDKGESFAEKKGASAEFNLYETVNQVAAKLLSERKEKIISPNVDFYSGFIYKLMGIPQELFTPIFAMARMAGWSAHRLEQIVQGKIMRPAYIASNTEESLYKRIDNR